MVFEVPSPSFIDEKSVRYIYLLNGSHIDKWSEPTTNATFDFINLSPGQYTLHVRAKFPAEIYESQEATYSFAIAPPWWQTWWFRSIILALLALLTVLFIRTYLRRKLLKQRIALERQQAIQKERTRIATDMHDDLGAGLSRIKFLSETIGMKKQLQQPIEEEVTSISGYANDMIGKMGEIVWALNEKNDSLVDLLSYTRSYAVDYLTNNGIHCLVMEESNFPSLFVSGEFRRNVYLSVKEALHNIVKHARANQVIIRIDASSSLIIWIEDDGVGFDKLKIRPFSNGLNNMQKRMQEIGGSFEMIQQRGTTVILKAPLHA
jgi:signal transduction histidine kinase